MDNNLNKIVGNNLLAYRKAQNLTQEALAEKAEISTSFYANLERCDKSMSIGVLCKVARALGVTTDSLLNEQNAVIEIENIRVLLQDKPVEFIAFVEKIIRLCADEFIISDKYDKI